jgi:hypothetical protein
MSKLSRALAKVKKLEPKKTTFEVNASDSPTIIKLKLKMNNLVDRVKKEGIQ